MYTYMGVINGFFTILLLCSKVQVYHQIILRQGKNVWSYDEAQCVCLKGANSSPRDNT